MIICVVKKNYDVQRIPLTHAKEGENSSPVVSKIKHTVHLSEPLFGKTNENALKAKDIHLHAFL